jgi:CHAT domain-containing protein
LDLNAELVTLSACETALGRQVRGEGVIGLAQAFVAAGARRALVTLWPVSDRSTATFMTEFYRELSRGASPGTALLTVRRRWVETGSPSRHPAYWAPFVLLGAPDQ